jgi:hypothetical protein
MKENMIKQVEEFWAERKMNEGMLPEKDQKAIDLEVVKEQILDLNDKFDYLLYVMMKDRRLQNKGGEYEIAEPQPSATSINAPSFHKATTELEELEVKDQVKNFEKAAKKRFGVDRKQFRKATPRQPVFKRIQEVRLQEIENEKRALLKAQQEQLEK